MKAFNGDSFVLEEFKRLKDAFDLKVCVETGTFMGDTTEVLAEIFPEVHTIEINKTYLAQAEAKVGDKSNVNMHEGSSPEKIKEIIAEGWNPGILFFLDAHWYDYCPLLDELLAIADKKIKPVIAIHDFKVPGKDFGFDSYKGQDYDFDWIKPSLDKIYGADGYSYYYNTESEGSMRGIIYIISR